MKSHFSLNVAYKESSDPYLLGWVERLITTESIKFITSERLHFLRCPEKILILSEYLKVLYVIASNLIKVTGHLT